MNDGARGLGAFQRGIERIYLERVLDNVAAGLIAG